MLGRLAIALIGLAVAFPASAGELNPDQERRFVVGKLFSFSCFDGTRGAGRIFADGSVAGTVQMGGNGSARYMSLPANTLRVSGQRVCASVKGMLFEPCFNLTQTDAQSFRGAIAGLGFAYCDFTRRDVVPTALRTTWRNPPPPIQAAAVAPAPAAP